MKGVRLFLALLVLLIGVVTLSYLQKRFDAADIRKGLEAVHKKFPEATNCKGRVTSRFRGEVMVICQEGGWRVNLVQGVLGGIYGTEKSSREMSR